MTSVQQSYSHVLLGGLDTPFPESPWVRAFTWDPDVDSIDTDVRLGVLYQVSADGTDSHSIVIDVLVVPAGVEPGASDNDVAVSVFTDKAKVDGDNTTLSAHTSVRTPGNRMIVAVYTTGGDAVLKAGAVAMTCNVPFLLTEVETDYDPLA